MTPTNRCRRGTRPRFLLTAWMSACSLWTCSLTHADMQGALLDPHQVTEQRLGELKSAGTNTVVLPLEGVDVTSRENVTAAVERVRRHGLRLYYWIEVGRCPSLADAHPEWMASLQGHDQWRRLFSAPPQPMDHEVVKVYPWVPIFYEEAYQAQLKRVAELLATTPPGDGVLLNDLQGAPSACGCGNTLCRWTADYGPIQTATATVAPAAARFVDEVRKLVVNAEVIPVWVTECEQHDGAADGACAGVGCFHGICWKAYTKQLMPVAQQGGWLGVLTPYLDFQRNLPVYGAEAGWIGQAVNSFQTMPPVHQGQAIASTRLLVILQGWNVDAEQIQAQIGQARAAAVGGFVVAYWKIDQSWQPRLQRWK